MTAAKPLHLRLFLEGEEVVVVSAQISININAPSSASIQIIPIDEGLDLKPRTMVHLFSYDEYSTEKSTYVPEGTYRLIFLGEVIGISTVKSPGSLGLVLQCIDFTSYWLTAHATAIQYGGQDSNAMVDHSEDTASDNLLFDDLPGGTIVEKLVEWLKETPKTPGLEEIEGLAGGIIRTIEAVGGVRDKDGSRTTGFNDFFTVAELRARILQQVCAEEKDPSAKKLLENQEFSGFIRNSLENLGKQITLNDVILLLLQYIMYDYIPNPAPKYEASIAYKETRSVSATNLSGTKYGEKAKSYLNQATSGLHSSYMSVSAEEKKVSDIEQNSKPIKDFKSLIPTPTDEFAPFEGFITAEDPNLRFGDKVAADIADKKKKNIKMLQASILSIAPILQKAQDLLKSQAQETPDAIPAIDEIVSYVQVAIVYVNRASSTNITLDDVARAMAVIDSAINTMDSTLVSGETVTYSGGAAQRLKSIIFRPNCWYAAPPRCNVIFPEQYYSLNYDRNWIGEVTRLRVGSAADTVGKDPVGLLNDYKYAPPKEMISKEDDVDIPRSYRFLMSHELHTGIVPRHMWVPEPLKLTEGQEDGPWLQNAAEFNYFSARFSTRTLSVGGRFNPHLVCGFPAVVMLRPMILKDNELNKASSPESLMTAEDVPYQLVGMIGTITHNVDQGGGSTTLAMTHVRRHRGLDDELLSLRYQVGSTADRIVSYVITRKDALNETEITSAGATGNLQTLAVPIPGGTGTAGFTNAEEMQTEVIEFTTSPDTRGIKRKLLTGSTPQLPPPPRASKVTQSKKSKQVTKKTSKVDPVTKKVVETTSTSTVEVNSESTATNTPDPSFTRDGSIPGVPGAEKVKVPDGPIEIVMGQTEGIYSGKVIGVEVVNNRRGKVGGRYAFESIRVYEKIGVTVQHSPPLEEIVKPSWVSDGFMNENITEKIYKPFFGCRSIVDDVTVRGVGKGSKAQYSGSSKSVINVDSKKDITQVKKQIENNETSRNQNSVDRAVTWWSYIYGSVKSTANKTKDVETFIRDFTYRPIATIDQILGSNNLQYVISGSRAVAVEGKEGFHTAAVNPTIVNASDVLKLVGLLDNPDSPFPRINEAAVTATIPKRYDVRYQKRQAVLAYKEGIVRRGRGLRG